jgi:hypothetical protein
MVKNVSFKRLILRMVLRQASPMVFRLFSVSDQMPLPEFRNMVDGLAPRVGVLPDIAFWDNAPA